MDNRLKRFLSLALAMVMVIGMVPTNIVFATEAEHQCTFAEIAKVEPTWATAGSRTLKCTCGQEKTEKICATGCWVGGSHDECEIMCDLDPYCQLDYGHEGVCMNAELGLLLDMSNIQSEEGLLAAIEIGGTIKLTANIELKAAVEIPNTVVLDLNGKSITVKAGSNIPYALINKGKLTVKGNGSVSGIQNEATGDNAGLVIENGTFTATGTETYAILNKGKATINGGTFTAVGGYAMWNHTQANLVINSGDIIGVYSEGNLDILGGDFRNVAGKHTVWSHGGKLNITAGKFQKSVNDPTVATVKISNNTTAVVTGGSFSNANGLSVELTQGNLTISGNSEVDDGIKVDAGATLTIEGGTFEDPTDYSYAPAEGANITINGGTYVEANAQTFGARYAAEGKVLKFKTGDVSEDVVKSGDYTMAKVVAKIGEVAYHSLADAVKVGGTIDVVADITVDSTIDVLKPVVLNMNNNTITSHVDGGYVFELNSDASTSCTSFVVNGGKFASTHANDLGLIDIHSVAAVSLKGCDIEFDTASGAIINANDTGNTAASLVLDGVDVVTNHMIVETASGKLQSVTVNGGEFESTAYGAFNLNVIDSVSIKNATITAAAMGVAVEGKGNTNATATFENNTITVNGNGAYQMADSSMTGFVIAVSAKVNATVKSGTYGSEEFSGEKLGLTATGTSLTIQNGTFNDTITNYNANGKVTITDGMFNDFVVDATGKLSISGGNYSADPSAHLAPYYKAVKGTNNRYTVLRKDVDGRMPADLGEVFEDSPIVVDDAKKNEIIEEILTDINNSTANMPEGVTLVITPVAITAENNADGNVVVSKIVYDVTPMAGDVALDELDEAVTFRLPIPSCINSYITLANVTHKGATTSMTIKVDEASVTKEKYIEITAKYFSEYTIELIDIDPKHHVAKIGIKGYPSVQDAVDAVKDGETVELLERVPAMGEGTQYGAVTLTLDKNKSFTIDGHGYAWEFDGTGPTVTINGAADAAQLTIKNVKFSTNKTTGTMVQINGADSNVLIENCDFTGPGSSSAMVAVSLKDATDVRIEGGTAAGLKAFLINEGGKDLQVKNVTINTSNVGMELGAVQGVVVDGVTITSTVGKYGISMDASVNNNAEFSNCNITAAVPVMVYGTPATTHGQITFSGTNTMTASSGYWIILADGKYSEMPSDTDVEKLTTTGRIVITVKDTGLKAEGINDKHKDESDANNRKFYTVAPKGKLENVIVIDEVTVDDSRISLDIKNLIASERIVLEILDAAGNKIAETKLVNTKDLLYLAELNASVDISNIENTWEKDWQTKWTTEHKVPTYKFVPATANLIVDGKTLNEQPIPVKMNAEGADARLWTDIEDVGNMTLHVGSTFTWKHSLAEALADAPKDGGIVKLYADNTAKLPANGELTGNKTVTVTGTGTFDWTKGWLFIGRGVNAGNGTLIFDNAHITAAGTAGITGFNVSGVRKGEDDICNGILKITNKSNVEVDFIVSRNEVVIDKESNLTVRNGFAIGGRPAAEVGASVDATATVTVTGASVLHVISDHDKGLGEEGRGVLIVDDATFICDGNFHIADEEGTALKVNRTSTLKIKKVVGKAIDMADGSKLVFSNVGGEVVANGAANKYIQIFFSKNDKIDKITLNYGTATFTEENVIGDLTVTNGAADVTGKSQFDTITITAGKLVTTSESLINAKAIKLMKADDVVIINTTKLAEATAVRVINQAEATGVDLTDRVKVMDEKADPASKTAPYVVYGDEADVGDVVASKVDRTEMYYHPDYNEEFGSLVKVGDAEVTGRYQGVNAFAKFKYADGKLKLPKVTTTLVLTTGNAEADAYGNLISTQNLTVKTEGDAAKYALINQIRNAKGDLTIAAGHKVKVLGTNVACGADDQGGIFTINGELYLLNKEGAENAFKLWASTSAHGQLKIGATGKLTAEKGNIGNDGSITVDLGGFITVKNITGKGTITINADALHTIEEVQVIELSGNAATKTLMNTMVSVKDDFAAKRVADDGDVFVYFEAFVDKNNDGNLGDGETGYSTLAKAVAAADNNQTVVLLTNAKKVKTIEIKKSITLDLNEHTVDGANPLAVMAGNVTVTNGKIIAKESGIQVAKDAGLTLTDVSLKTMELGILSFGNVTIDGETEVKATGALDGSAGYGLIMAGAAKTTLKSGKISGSGEAATYIFGGTLEMTGGTIDGADGWAIVTNCYDDELSAKTDVVISGGNVTGGIYAAMDDPENMPEGYTATVRISGGNFTNNFLFTTGAAETFRVSGGTFDSRVPILMCVENYICRKKANTALFEVVPYQHTRVDLSQVSNGLILEGDQVHFDGKPYEVYEDLIVALDTEQAKKKEMFVTTYRMEGSGESAYPSEMFVWYAKGTDNNNDGICDSYAVERVAILDNFFQYHGTSIRVGSAKNGIRFFSSVNASDASKLMNGTLITTGTLKNAKMVGAGTVFKKNVSYVNLENGLSSYVFGGTAGKTFRVFQKYSGRNWFTGVLTNLDTDGKTINDPIATRPYAELEIGGKKVALYGGPLERSIYYVATQNKDYFKQGSTYDKFVENLIKMGDEAKANP